MFSGARATTAGSSTGQLGFTSPAPSRSPALRHFLAGHHHPTPAPSRPRCQSMRCAPTHAQQGRPGPRAPAPREAFGGRRRRGSGSRNCSGCAGEGTRKRPAARAAAPWGLEDAAPATEEGRLAPRRREDGGPRGPGRWRRRRGALGLRQDEPEAGRARRGGGEPEQAQAGEGRRGTRKAGGGGGRPPPCGFPVGGRGARRAVGTAGLEIRIITIIITIKQPASSGALP